MITMTTEQLEKIDLLDRLFGAMSIEQLREFTESEQVMANLKGTNQNPGILRKIVQENEIMMSDLNIAKSDILTLRTDIRVLVNLTIRPYEQFSIAEFNSLKLRHNAY